jgi:hypothetical protein
MQICLQSSKYLLYGRVSPAMLALLSELQEDQQSETDFGR